MLPRPSRSPRRASSVAGVPAEQCIRFSPFGSLLEAGGGKQQIVSRGMVEGLACNGAASPRHCTVLVRISMGEYLHGVATFRRFIPDGVPGTSNLF